MWNSPSSYLYYFTNVGGIHLFADRRHLLVKTWSFLVTGNLIFALALIIVSIFVEEDQGLRLELIGFCTTETHVLARHLRILFRYDDFVGIVRKLDAAWEEGKLQDNCERHYEKTERIVMKFYRVCMFTFLVLVPIKIIECVQRNWGLSRDDWHQPLAIWTPLGREWYWTVSIWQMWSLFCACLATGITALITFTICQFVVLNMKVLRQSLKDRNPRTCFSKLSYIKHQRILSVVRDVNNLLAAPHFLQMLVNSVEVAVRIQFLIRVLRYNAYAVGAGILFILLTGTTPFLICYCGSIISVQNDLLYQDCYQNKWYKESVKSRKDLLIISTMATKPLSLHYRFLLTYGMEQFADFCRAVYSYVMILQFFESHR